MKRFTATMACAATLAAALTSAPGARADAIRTGYLFATDYGLSQLDRYQYTYNQTTNAITSITAAGIGGNTTSAYFLGGGQAPIKEGLQGTANDLIVVGGRHGTGLTNFSRFTLDGTYLGQIPVDFSSYNGGNVAIGNVVATPDGRFAYAPLETGGAIVKIDLASGAIVANYAFAGAHDVALAANGTVYAANYASGDARVIALNANLDAASLTVLASAAPTGVSGTFRPTGLSVAADGSLYVNDNTMGGTDSVLHYKIGTSNGSPTATFDAPGSYIGGTGNAALEFTFGSNIGPDGKIYEATLGGGGGVFNTRPGFVDGIYAFDPSAGTVSQIVAGYTEGKGTAGPSGLDAPKYLQFDTNFIKSNDVGVPEPGSLAVLATGLIGFAVLRRRATR